MRSLAWLFFLAACSPDAKFEVAKNAIINGMPSDTDDDAAIAIGIFSSGGSFQGACSGTLIAPNLVLTARHCVAQVNEAGIACDADGTPISGGDVYNDYDPANLKILVGSQLSFDFAATGMQIIHNDATNLCNNDISLLLLDTKITTAPFAQIRLDTPPLVDETFRAVGWGVSNNSSGYGRRKRDGIAIELVGPDQLGLSRVVPPHEFGIGEGICSGDSGGPAFDETTKAVIGLVSRGGNGAPFNPMTQPAYTPCVDSGQYTTFNLYTRTDSFKDLIMSGFAAAGTDPWLEGGPDPRLAKFGVACMADGDCRSAVCDQGMCSQSCDDATPCPDGFVCGADGDRMNICVVPAPPSSCSTTSAPTPAWSGAWLLLAALALFGLAASRRVSLLFATRNAGKLRELRALVGGLDVVSPDDVAIPLVDEDAPTFEGNAVKKARSGCVATGLPTLADDSGLEVDALGGAPGVHSARFAGGEGHDDNANNEKLLASLAGVPDQQRGARFRCVLALVTPDGVVITTSGSVEGRIAGVRRGDGGFGYDPLFIVAETAGKTMAELDSDEKNRISHRARAMAAMAPHLANLK